LTNGDWIDNAYPAIPWRPESAFRPISGSPAGLPPAIAPEKLFFRIVRLSVASGVSVAMNFQIDDPPFIIPH
jgi:hypothetical protein